MDAITKLNFLFNKQMDSLPPEMIQHIAEFLLPKYQIRLGLASSWIWRCMPTQVFKILAGLAASHKKINEIEYTMYTTSGNKFSIVSRTIGRIIYVEDGCQPGRPIYQAWYSKPSNILHIYKLETIGAGCDHIQLLERFVLGQGDAPYLQINNGTPYMQTASNARTLHLAKCYNCQNSIVWKNSRCYTAITLLKN
jgi:hypothetical protein